MKLIFYVNDLLNKSFNMKDLDHENVPRIGPT